MKVFSILDDEQIKKWIDEMGIDDPIFFHDRLVSLEAQENWTFEKNSKCYQQFSMIADALSDILDRSPDKKDPVIKEKLTEFLRIMAYRNISASFRLLSILHKIQPSLTVKLLQLCQTSQVEHIQPEAMLFLTRTQILLKTECLKRIFGRQRREEIINLLEKMEG
ncbi:MAG: hypothetical protein GY710_26660 [Desulfobacteraceae bacterium]|nr:hypothetical protein [Desulfobacteraceae bacterium]